MKIGKYWLVPGKLAYESVMLCIFGLIGLGFGAIFAIGMNQIHPLF